MPTAPMGAYVDQLAQLGSAMHGTLAQQIGTTKKEDEGSDKDGRVGRASLRACRSP